MGDTRIRYGLAYGRQNNFVTGSTDQTTRGYLAGTDGLFKQADTTPDVTNGFLFYTNNSAATTITNFDLQHPVGTNTGNLAGLFEGKVIKIFFLDTATTIANSSRIVLADSANQTFNQNSVLELIYHTSSWYEMSRNVTVPFGTELSRTITLAATNAAITVVPTDNVLVLTGTIALTTVTGISGGYIGQRLVLVTGSGGANIKFAHTNSSGIGNIYFATTAEFLIGNGNSTSAVNSVVVNKVSATAWSIPSLCE